MTAWIAVQCGIMSLYCFLFYLSHFAICSNGRNLMRTCIGNFHRIYRILHRTIFWKILKQVWYFISVSFYHPTFSTEILFQKRMPDFRMSVVVNMGSVELLNCYASTCFTYYITRIRPFFLPADAARATLSKVCFMAYLSSYHQETFSDSSNVHEKDQSKLEVKTQLIHFRTLTLFEFTYDD